MVINTIEQFYCYLNNFESPLLRFDPYKTYFIGIIYQTMILILKFYKLLYREWCSFAVRTCDGQTEIIISIMLCCCECMFISIKYIMLFCCECMFISILLYDCQYHFILLRMNVYQYFVILLRMYVFYYFVILLRMYVYQYLQYVYQYNMLFCCECMFISTSEEKTKFGHFLVFQLIHKCQPAARTIEIYSHGASV